MQLTRVPAEIRRALAPAELRRSSIEGEQRRSVPGLRERAVVAREVRTVRPVESRTALVPGEPRGPAADRTAPVPV